MSAESSSAPCADTGADDLHDLFHWLRAAGAVEDHVPARILAACLAVEWGITTEQARALVQRRLECIGHADLPVLVSGRDAAYVLATADPGAA